LPSWQNKTRQKQSLLSRFSAAVLGGLQVKGYLFCPPWQNKTRQKQALLSRFSAAVLGGSQIRGISILPSLAKQNAVDVYFHGVVVYEREALLFEELVQPVKGELLLLSGV